MNCTDRGAPPFVTEEVNAATGAMVEIGGWVGVGVGVIVIVGVGVGLCVGVTVGVGVGVSEDDKTVIMPPFITDWNPEGPETYTVTE